MQYLQSDQKIIFELQCRIIGYFNLFIIINWLNLSHLTKHNV